MDNQKITVHIVDDDPSTRNYLKELILSDNYKAKVYETADNFLEVYRDDGIGCLILDLHLPGISGLDLQSQLTGKNIDLPVIMITGYGDVPTAVKAMKAGVLDFIEKPFRGKFMLERVQNAINRHKDTRQQKQQNSDINKRIDALTNRENEVFALVVKGKQNKDIATELGISIKTVEVHRANVMSKMQAKSIAELVRMHLQVKETQTSPQTN